jgi:hypothetical protein
MQVLARNGQLMVVSHDLAAVRPRSSEQFTAQIIFYRFGARSMRYLLGQDYSLSVPVSSTLLGYALQYLSRSFILQLIWRVVSRNGRLLGFSAG